MMRLFTTMFGSGNRIVSARVPGVTTADTAYGIGQAFDGSVDSYGLLGIG
jgi:hypothetical protein